MNDPDKWQEIAFRIYDIPVIATADCRVNGVYFRDNHVKELAKHVMALDSFLRFHNMKLSSIGVEDVKHGR